MLDRRLPLFFFNDTATTEIYTLSLHDALPIYGEIGARFFDGARRGEICAAVRPREGGSLLLSRSEEHNVELQSLAYLVCRLLLEKKKYALFVAAGETGSILRVSSVQ